MLEITDARDYPWKAAFSEQEMILVQNVHLLIAVQRTVLVQRLLQRKAHVLP